MTQPRVVETDQGIQGEFTVAMYDQMQRKFRQRGWIETDDVIKHGITRGLALEIGPGPGYLGLEWLKKTDGTRLKGLDLSLDMIALAQHNAQDYGLTQRVEYVHGNGNELPFESDTFDAVFSNGSLHEWADPHGVYNEIWRTLKPGGRFYISDLRRDVLLPLRWFLWFSTDPKEMRPGLTTSLNAAYTPDELRGLVRDTKLTTCTVASNLLGVTVSGAK